MASYTKQENDSKAAVILAAGRDVRQPLASDKSILNPTALWISTNGGKLLTFTSSKNKIRKQNFQDREAKADSMKLWT